MMSQAEIDAYRIELRSQLLNHHAARMNAMDEKRYYLMAEESRKFDMVAARIDTIDKIFKD